MELQAYDEVDICMYVYIDDDQEYNQLMITSIDLIIIIGRYKVAEVETCNQMVKKV